MGAGRVGESMAKATAYTKALAGGAVPVGGTEEGLGIER